MKRYLLAFFIVVGSLGLKAQWVSIPDANFATYLQATFPSCMNGSLMDTTCPAIVNATGVFCLSRNISNLTGIQYFDNLDTLHCQVNKITILPALANTIRVLYCSDNLLTGLPSLPNSLTYLVCGDNSQLSSLPALPSGLTYLDCAFSMLSSLPILPNGLTYLQCNGNQLSNLPELPSGLTSLNCRANQLNSLPSLPNGLTNLACNNNQLTSLPEFPDSLSYCSIVNNPITCLPRLKRVIDFYFTNTLVTCLPNYGNISNSLPLLASVPLCGIFNEKACNSYWNINGKVYLDSSMNCVYNVGEHTYGNIKIQLYDNGVLKQQTNTVAGGNYLFDTEFSTYQYSVDTTNLPFAVACPAAGYYTSTIASGDSFDLDMSFGFHCKSGFDLAANSISTGRFRPAQYTSLAITAGDYSSFFGAHCIAGVSGSVTVTISGPASYNSPASGALIPSNVTGNTITYNVADFGAVNFFSDFNMMVQTDTTAQIGDEVCITVSVTPTAGDYNPANNTLTQCFTVVGSYDPNIKEVFPIADIDTAQEWLTYTIHFQNTGTAEAQHIYVTDTLNSNVDPASFQLLAYSHQPMVQIKENAVRFNFPNINLPDSNTNEAASHGYVQYKVKLKDNLPVGTPIFNTAFIYFDFNAPVVTNTTSNTIALSTGLRAVSQEPLAFRVYPNPANESVTISVDENMIGSKLSITDITGRRILISNIEHRISNVEVRELASGVYFVTLENERERVTKKLVIER